MQGRGRSRQRKAGLQKRGPPSKANNDARIDKMNAEILDYLEEELKNLLAMPGMFKEVAQVGRTIKQLRSDAPGDSAPRGPSPHDRQNFSLPPELRP